MRFYKTEPASESELDRFMTSINLHDYYTAPASAELLKLFPQEWPRGLTVTCPGFYGPQGRQLRAPLSYPSLLDDLRQYSGQPRITNFEMETAGIYGLGELLGHQCISISVIVANRETKEFSGDAGKAVEGVIGEVMTGWPLQVL